MSEDFKFRLFVLVALGFIVCVHLHMVIDVVSKNEQQNKRLLEEIKE